MTRRNPETAERAMQLRRMTAERLRTMTPQERDRVMQVHLAQARGPVANAMLMRQLTATMLRIKKTRQETESDHA
ncbi:MAG: hypothetical protein KJ749_11915 [Planctomycetes bacterium]|nr:hypothetical protein [Planctomycetota bacterium]